MFKFMYYNSNCKIKYFLLYESNLYSLIIVYKSESQYIIGILKIISIKYSSLYRIKIKIKQIISLKN